MIWLILTLFLFSTHPSLAHPTVPKARWVQITASVGQNYLTTIFGYGPPESRIELTSPQVFSATFSDHTGYFEFSSLVLPQNPQDLCLQALDENQRSTLPVCIPPPPGSDYSYKIGPILLPPTISLDADQLNTQNTTIASGQSFPNSDVLVTFFQVDSNPSLIVKPVVAIELPQLTLRSDNSGNFSFSLPTTYLTSYRFFVSAVYNNQPSPRSNPLFYTLLQPKSFNPLILVILILLVIFIIFTLRHFHSRRHFRYLPWLPPSLVPLNHIK